MAKVLSPDDPCNIKGYLIGTRAITCSPRVAVVQDKVHTCWCEAVPDSYTSICRGFTLLYVHHWCTHRAQEGHNCFGSPVRWHSHAQYIRGSLHICVDQIMCDTQQVDLKQQEIHLLGDSRFSTISSCYWTRVDFIVCVKCYIWKFANAFHEKHSHEIKSLANRYRSALL